MESPYQQLSQFDLLSKARSAYQDAYEQAQAEHPDFSDAQINLFLSGKLGASQSTAPMLGGNGRWHVPNSDSAKNVDVINAGNGLVLAHNKLTGETQIVNPERVAKTPQQFQTITEKVPASDAKEAQPADINTHPILNFLNRFSLDGQLGLIPPLEPTTNSLAVAGSPAVLEHTRSYKIPIPAIPDSTPAAAPAPAAPAAPVFRIASPMGTSGFVGQNPRTESGFIGTPGGANLFRTTAQLNGQPAAAVDNVDAPKPKGVTVKDKATGKTFIYRGNPQDIPTDKYSIMQ
jgi:hypothetical protein